jgi:predicted exporter
VKFRQRLVLALWLIGLAGCAIVIVTSTHVRTDMAGFLPGASTPQQEFLVSQLREGTASRLILIGLENAPAADLANISKSLIGKLRHGERFWYVANGTQVWTRDEQELLMRHRYLLSPSIDRGHFTAPSLRRALEDSLHRLTSPLGAVEKHLLPADPTGELRRIMEQWEPAEGTRLEHGVWFSPDARRALLVAETRAPPFDLDNQQATVGEIQQAFDAIAANSGARLVLSGPAVFALSSRDAISQDAWRLSLFATALVIVLVWSVYRSVWLVALSVLPLLTGILVAVAVVSVSFEYIHGITLAFGVTLTGVALDYPIHLFTHVRRSERTQTTIERIWPTLRLAVATTVIGYFAMLFSDFPGLTQLGVFAAAGLISAAATTRWLLPVLLPRHVPSLVISAWSRKALDWLNFIHRWRFGFLAGMVAAVVFLFVGPTPFWQDDLAALSPVPEHDKRLDRELRFQLGAPDVRKVIVMRADTSQQVLELCEGIMPALEEFARQAKLKGFDPACRYVPSIRTQQARQAVLPDGSVLRDNLRRAVAGSPFRSGLFSPFLRDVEASKSLLPVELRDLQGTALGLRVGNLLFPYDQAWAGVILLRGVEDGAAIDRWVAGLGNEAVFTLDLKSESERMVKAYRDQALSVWGIGIAAVVLVLLAGTRSVGTLLRVIIPVTASVMVVCALLLALGQSLSLFHLVALLLVVGLGLDYGLFFNSTFAHAGDRRRTALSLLICSSTTILVFGVLALSRIPVLSAIGITVALGSVFCLILAAAFRERQLSE